MNGGGGAPKPPLQSPQSIFIVGRSKIFGPY
ncbi:hypothetical protein L345_14281, partial [Ophiophagus hannah]